MIKIVFVSNYFNHHEKSFCDELSKLPGIEFTFIQTMQMDEERIRLGWGIDVSSVSYVSCSYGNGNEYEEALKLCAEADVLILGSAPDEFVKERVNSNKLTFYYAERLFRKGLWHMLYPPTFWRVLKRFILPGNKTNFYMLCASGYTALDCYKINAFRNKYFKWGHFIEIKPYEQAQRILQDKIINQAKPVSILWAGRLIELKHPELVILTANRLKQQGYQFDLNIIGTGILEDYLKNMVDQYHLSDCVHFLGTMQPQEVRTYMEASDIYLFTSDFNEGWGAVLGEAMASGCAVVVSHGIGATPFLVRHMHNGLIYETGNIDSLYRNVKQLVDSSELRISLAEQAIYTMSNLWNAEVGAERFYNVAIALLASNPIPTYSDGPMSIPVLLKNNWFKDDTI